MDEIYYCLGQRITTPTKSANKNSRSNSTFRRCEFGAAQLPKRRNSECSALTFTGVSRSISHGEEYGENFIRFLFAASVCTLVRKDSGRHELWNVGEEKVAKMKPIIMLDGTLEHYPNNEGPKWRWSNVTAFIELLDSDTFHKKYHHVQMIEGLTDCPDDSIQVTDEGKDKIVFNFHGDKNKGLLQLLLPQELSPKDEELIKATAILRNIGQNGQTVLELACSKYEPL